MFERFTDRARRALMLAQEEARLLNHGFIGTEHLLLGLIREHDGVAARTLADLGVELDDVRAGVQERVGVPATAPTGSPPFTPRAKKVLELSLREALQLGHNYIGTEHILLGVVREGEGVAAQVLVSLGADLARVRQRVIGILGGAAGARRVEQVEAGVDVGRLPRARAGRNRVRRCALCRRDLWELERYVAAADGAVCAACVDRAATALAAGGAAVEVPFPPRAFGPAPEGDVAAVTAAFVAVFTDAAGPVAADAEGLRGDLRRALHEPGPVRPPRFERIRFTDPDTAEVVFEPRCGPGLGRRVEGRAVRRDGRWLVTRDTVVRYLAGPGR